MHEEGGVDITGLYGSSGICLRGIYRASHRTVTATTCASGEAQTETATSAPEKESPASSTRKDGLGKDYGPRPLQRKTQEDECVG